MKPFLLRLFLRRPVIAQIAAAIASAAAAYGMTLIPGAPELVKLLLVAVLQLPEGTELTQAGLTTALTPLVLGIINAVVAELEGRNNNALLAELKDAGVYDGKLDRVVGPVAKKAVNELVEQSRGLFR